MKPQRALAGSYAFVALGIVAGALYGAFGPGEPALGRWIFGIGVGLTGGAFLAANVSGVQLLGGGPAADDLDVGGDGPYVDGPGHGGPEPGGPEHGGPDIDDHGPAGPPPGTHTRNGTGPGRHPAAAPAPRSGRRDR